MHKHSGRNGSVAEEFGLRGDIGKSRGVTTFIESNADKDLEYGGQEMNRHKSLKGIRSTNSVRRLTEGSSGEEEEERTQNNWRTGITKTTVSTQVAH
jgi:hypothetical protein